MRWSSRRGSMQLSIEAIIVLVIAMVLLTLGLTFVKDLFGEGTDALLGTFDPIKAKCNVNRENPILPLEYTLNAGSKEGANICVFNNLDAPVTSAKLEVIECLLPNGGNVKADLDDTTQALVTNSEGLPLIDGSTNVFPISISSLGEEIPRNEARGYKVAVSTGSAQVGTYQCRVRAYDTQNMIIGPVQVVFNLE